jgi:hypothetical protein
VRVDEAGSAEGMRKREKKRAKIENEKKRRRSK